MLTRYIINSGHLEMNSPEKGRGMVQMDLNIPYGLSIHVHIEGPILLPKGVLPEQGVCVCV